MPKTPFIMKKMYRRTKPSIQVRKTKNGLDIIKTMYDDFGKVVKKQVESIKK